MTQDIAFSKDRNQNPLTVKKVEYIKSIVYMLFRIRPGDDPYNPNKGLDVESLVYKTESELVSYEETIKEQFRLYTDIIINGVNFIVSGTKIGINLSILHEGEVYNLITGNTATDISQIILTEGGIE